MEFRVLFAVLVTCFVVCSGSKQPTKKPAIPSLKNTTFNDFIDEHSNVVVEYIAPWCGHCTAFQPIFEDVAMLLKTEAVDVDLAKVTMETEGNDDLMLSQGIPYEFPTLVLYKEGKMTDIFLGNKTDKKEILLWIEQWTGPPVHIAKTKSEAEAYAASFPVSFFGVFSDEQSLMFDVFTAAAADSRAFGRFVTYFEGGSSARVWVKHPDEPVVEGTFTTRLELDKWLKSARFPLLGKLTGANQALYYQRGLDACFFVGNRKHYEEYGKVLREVASKYSSKFSFLWLDIEVFTNYKTVFLVDSVPSLLVINGTKTKSHKRYVLPSNKFNDINVIADHLDKVIEGKAERKIMSLPLRASRVAEDDVVKYVVGDNFEMHVMRDDRDVLLAVALPPGRGQSSGCAQCDIFAIDYEIFAKALEKYRDRLSVVLISAKGNEIPVGGFEYDPYEIPKVFFVKKGSKTPIAFDGEKKIPPALLDFWVKHNSFGIERPQLQKELQNMYEAAVKESQKLATQSGRDEL